MSQSHWGLVFVHGTHIFPYLHPVPVRFRFIPDLVAWSEGSKSSSNVTLPKQAWAQKDMQAITHTVTLKGSMKSKWQRREQRCEIVTESCLGHIEWGVARDNEAFMMCFKADAPCQGAPLMTCQNSRPSNQCLMVPAETLNAP